MAESANFSVDSIKQERMPDNRWPVQKECSLSGYGKASVLAKLDERTRKSTS